MTPAHHIYISTTNNFQKIFMKVRLDWNIEIKDLIICLCKYPLTFFVKLTQSLLALGVKTYKKTFLTMLFDSKISERNFWFYKNLKRWKTKESEW